MYFSIFLSSYQSLANLTLEQQKSRSDWELELGEPAVDLQTIGSFIVVLGERHLYCLKDTGSVVWTRKLDYHPMCCNLLIPRTKIILLLTKKGD